MPRIPASGVGGLRKPSLRVPPLGTGSNPGYHRNTDPNAVAQSNENDYVVNREVATALGKALFWDMQVGSDGVQSCGTCTRAPARGPSLTRDTCLCAATHPEVESQ